MHYLRIHEEFYKEVIGELSKFLGGGFIGENFQRTTKIA